MRRPQAAQKRHVAARHLRRNLARLSDRTHHHCGLVTRPRRRRHRGVLLDQRQANAGSFAQLEKARLVAKLKAARDRKREATGRCEGRKSYADAMPATVALAKQLHADGLSYRKISAELAVQGHVTGSGKHHVASAVQKMLGR